MKAKELRQKSTEELLELLKQLKEELRILDTLRMNGRPFNYGRRRVVKRDIARILTILNERKRNA